MLEFNMLAFVLCCNWLVAHGPPAFSFFCKMYLKGSWTSRSAGFFEGRQIWEVHLWGIFILYMFGISTHVYVYIYVYL